MKKKKVTHTMQRVAVDILQDLEIILMMHNEQHPHFTAEEIIAVINKHEQKYALCQDPFTGMLCTSEEYMENSLEYAKQTMICRYGHCDGLD
jgi:hypothetical protein